MPRSSLLSSRPGPSLVDELAAVLAPHPGGLRRWSVMNAIRKARMAEGRDVPLKMEADIERAFRAACGDNPAARFRRPAETAGEVWALNPNYVALEAAE